MIIKNGWSLMQVLKEEIRIKILETAKGLFLANSFEKASMNMIAKKVGISKSNLYNYFPSKEEIFLCLTDKAYAEIQNLSDNLLNHEAGVAFDLNKFLAFMSNEIIRILIKYREKMLLIMDCSKGTRYENVKQKLIFHLQQHFIKEFKVHHVSMDDDGFFSHYISTSLIEGLLEPIRHNKSDEWISKNIKILLEYHINGYAHFLADCKS